MILLTVPHIIRIRCLAKSGVTRQMVLFQTDDFVWENDTIKQTYCQMDSRRIPWLDGVAQQYILESGLFKYGPGDVRFKDLNGDDTIDYGSNTVGDPGDRTVIGNTNPRYQYGFRLGLTGKDST